MLGLQTSQRPLHNLLNTENIRNENGILKLIARLELYNNKLHYININIHLYNYTLILNIY